jgi:hypothetical protein
MWLAEKILKYEDLVIEIQRMRNAKASVIPVITGATGTISKSVRQYLSNISGNHEIKEIQKQPCWALKPTTESVNVKVQNIFHGRNNITCSTNCKYRTAATIYSLETLFVFRYIIVNTLHKGDDKDDDDDDNNNNNNSNNNVCEII